MTSERRTIAAPCTIARILPSATSRGRYFIPQSVATMMFSGATKGSACRIRAATFSGVSTAMSDRSRMIAAYPKLCQVDRAEDGGAEGSRRGPRHRERVREDELGLPSVLFGVGLPDENAHAPNEKLDLSNFHNGIIASAFLYDEIANIE